ncbi:MAG: alkaline phosphatase [Tissierellia bacterium]|nr:alkaline phosphatase [Tissierellia bacterium]
MNFNKKKLLVLGLVLALLIGMIAVPRGEADVLSEGMQTVEAASEDRAKYMFLFIGDGMAHVQVNAAQVFTGNSKPGEIKPGKINFLDFPITGVATTQDSTSFCPDSASTATSIAGGVKTHSGVIGLTQDKKNKVETIAETAKKNGKKVGIISSVTLNHATPAAFYANVESRGSYYEIGKQMADSGFDYFAGGSLGARKDKSGDKKDLYDVMKEKGYKVTETKADFERINAKTGKVYAVAERLQDSGSMPYSIDQNKNDISLANFVDKGIEVLDNDKGFFMMVESGKIDWACHANDAATTAREVLGFADAIQVAIDFYNKHPEETLILITGDHETGGLTIGQSTTGYETAFEMLRNQKMSFTEMDNLIKAELEKKPNLTFEEMKPLIRNWTSLIFPSQANNSIEYSLGEHEEMTLVLTDYEVNLIKNAFEKTKAIHNAGKPPEDMASQENYILYGGYEPLSVTLTHILNNKSGVGWTSYSHTGVPVAVYAIGPTAETYGGFYDNTDIYHKMMKSFGYK